MSKHIRIYLRRVTFAPGNLLLNLFEGNQALTLMEQAASGLGIGPAREL